MTQQLAEPPLWESPQWQEAVSQNPGLSHFFDNLESFVELPQGVERLRLLVLDLAVRGKVVDQLEADDCVANAIDQIAELKANLLEKKAIQKDKKYASTIKEKPPWPVPESWSWIRLQDAFEVVRGGSPRPAGDPRFFGGDIPWITVREITKDRSLFLTETRDTITELGSEKSRFVRLDDLLLTNSGATLGVPKINKITGCINDGVAFLNAFHEFIDKPFAYYFLTQQTRAFRAVNQGMGQPNLNTPILAGWWFPLPPLAEQRRIVSKVEGLMSLCDTLESQRRARMSVRERASRSVLSRLTSSPASALSNTVSKETLNSSWQRLSDHFEVLLDQPETLAHLRQSILQLAVQGKLVPQDPNDECVDNAICSARKIAGMPQCELGNHEGDFSIPEKWRWVTVHDVANHRLGKMLDKAKNTGNPQPYLRNTNVHWFRFELDSIKEMLFEDDDVEEFTVRRGDLMICEGGHGIARTAVWECELERIMFQKALHRVRPFHCLNSYFLAFCFRVYEATGILQRYYTGAGIPHFTGRSLAKVVFPLPPLAEQKRIVSKVSSLLSQVDEASQQLLSRQTTTDAILTALIHQLMTNSSNSRNRYLTRK
ncbi:restriction endonuclease subunit S [Mariniblastus sp.]|nr:restriction endonuclease subunit S [Mariniblastus sp.]